MPRNLNALLSSNDYRSKLPVIYISSTKQNCLPQSFGWMTICCESCSALHWLLECVKISSKNSPRFENCCKQGSVVLEPPKD